MLVYRMHPNFAERILEKLEVPHISLILIVLPPFKGILKLTNMYSDIILRRFSTSFLYSIYFAYYPLSSSLFVRYHDNCISVWKTIQYYDTLVIYEVWYMKNLSLQVKTHHRYLDCCDCAIGKKLSNRTNIILISLKILIFSPSYRLLIL